MFSARMSDPSYIQHLMIAELNHPPTYLPGPPCCKVSGSAFERPASPIEYAQEAIPYGSSRGA